MSASTLARYSLSACTDSEAKVAGAPPPEACTGGGTVATAPDSEVGRNVVAEIATTSTSASSVACNGIRTFINMYNHFIAMYRKCLPQSGHTGVAQVDRLVTKARRDPRCFASITNNYFIFTSVTCPGWRVSGPAGKGRSEIVRHIGPFNVAHEMALCSLSNSNVNKLEARGSPGKGKTSVLRTITPK